MSISLSNFVTVENPPWASQSRSAGRATVYVQAPVYDGFFKKALRRKLFLLYGASQSVELDRQVLLALHDSPLLKAQIELLDGTLDGSIRFGSLAKRTALRQSHDVDILALNDILPNPDSLSDFLPKSCALGFGQILLLHFFSFLIDRLADYWNAVAQGRRAWRDLRVTLRQLRDRTLQFKPFHTPFLMIPRSLHPIDLAA